MTGTALPPELVSLVHHVELNKAGWWQKALQQLVTAAIWIAPDNPSAEQIRHNLKDQLALDIDAATLNNTLEALCEAGTLLRLPGGQVGIAQEALKTFEGGLEEAEQCRDAAKAKFSDILQSCCPALDADAIWESFTDDCLGPIIRDMGARTYEMVSGSLAQLDTTATLGRFIESFPAEVQSQLRTAIITFIDPRDADVRSFVLRLLNAHFFVAAGSMSERQVETLAQTVNAEHRINVFVDTNFLFSIMGIHENPSNEAAETLMELVDKLPPSVELKFFIAPITADETRQVLVSAKESVRDLRLTPGMAKAAVHSGLSGLAMKFAQEAQRQKGSLTPEDFFGPYITDLVRIVRARGVELFNQKADSYRTDQRVVDDINDRLEFEKSMYGSRAKGYQAILHDMVLWHWMHDLRPAIVESPADAGYWIATVDYRFLGFDRFKRKSKQTSLPICVHPLSLMQMLQFWVPRTPDFEQAMLSSLRLPFLFQEFDQEAEKTTLQILNVLSRFENSDDLSGETITSILTNQSLRQKLVGEHAIETQIELVKEAMIDEVNITREKLEESDARLKAAAVELQQERARTRAAEERADASASEATAATAAADEAEELAAKTALRQAEQRETSSRRTRFAMVWVAAPLLFVVVVAGAALIPLALLAESPWWSWAAISSLAFLPCDPDPVFRTPRL